jgi:NMD protein affecting ribosome stability and mRNA decay
MTKLSRDQERRKRLLDEGKCMRCGKRREDTFAKLCEACVKRARAASRAYYQRKHAKGAWFVTCPKCGQNHQARSCDQ